MKRIFTLLALLVSTLSSFSQVGTIYRWVGSAGLGTNTNDLGYVGSSVGASSANFLDRNNWRIITAGVPSATAPASNPSTGATLEFFGQGINIYGGDINLSAYVFTILIRSQYNAAAPTTNMNLGFIYLEQKRTLTLGAGSKITLGWGTATIGADTYWTPGYLILDGKNGVGNTTSIVIGATAVASANSDSYLNANGYAATSTAATTPSSTTAPVASHIRNLVNAPTGNISSNIAPLPTAYFPSFAYFYTAPNASPSIVAPLPLQLGAFSAQKGAGKVTLSWKTVLEVNTSHFEIEQSNNGASWKTLSVVAAKGNSNSAQNYSADDIATYSSKVYYRLKMVDIDGKFEYSPIAVVTFGGKGKIFAYPNPATSFTMVSSDNAITENVTVSIFNTTGILVKQQVITNPGNNFRVGLEDLKQGSYILKINQGNELLEVIKIQKN